MTYQVPRPTEPRKILLDMLSLRLLALYFYANEIVIGYMIVLLVSLYLIATYTSAHPLIG
jgi:hypothetical protein